MAEAPRNQALLGDANDLLDTLPADHFHAAVTDPPYELGFMGKAWDSTGVAYSVDLWKKVARVLRPGAYLLAFGGTRTYHRLACAIEDAGFEIRGQMQWIYGSGFPKSLNVHKAIKKMIESRYGNSQCNCLDEGDGRSPGKSSRRRSGAKIRIHGTASVEEEGASENSELPLVSGPKSSTVRKLRESDVPKTKRSGSVEEAVLLDNMCGSGAEEKGQRNAPIRAGMEESKSGDSIKGQEMPGVRKDSETKRISTPRTPSKTVSHGGDESTSESCRPLRPMPSQNRGDHGAGTVLDPDRHSARKIILDDNRGRREAVAFICSWCGLPDSKQIDSVCGFGTALKPAHEPICIARKPLSEKTVAANVLRWGTGALNIDDSRIGDGCESQGTREGEPSANRSYRNNGGTDFTGKPGPRGGGETGRFPSDIILDEEAGKMLDEQSGDRKAGGSLSGNEPSRTGGPGTVAYGEFKDRLSWDSYADSGGASRFFYCAKASAEERGYGNTHPTVKPVKLMQYLIRLVTPAGGIVLDPFLGSGTTAVACRGLGVDWVGIEKDAGHMKIIQERLGRDLL